MFIYLLFKVKLEEFERNNLTLKPINNCSVVLEQKNTDVYFVYVLFQDHVQLN